MKFPSKVRLHFDGSCLPKNPGGTARGAWIIKDGDGNTLAADSAVACSGPAATNNVAEWFALWSALRHLTAEGFTGELEILGDSELVINQLNRIYRCTKEHLRNYRDECWQMLESVTWAARWVPREENVEADLMSKG